MPGQTPFDHIAAAGDLLAQGRAAAAVALLREAMASGRTGPLTELVLGRALVASGEGAKAVAILREVRHFLPSSAEAASALADALLAEDALPTAIAEYQRALRLDPAHAPAELGLARAWLAAGEWEKAEPRLAAAKLSGAPLQTIAALEAEIASLRAQPRSPRNYVRHLFDDFAAGYDARMHGQLAYRAPEILLEMHAFIASPSAPVDSLDLGCGTGLAGAAFKKHARSITGVDLSPRMIERARARGIYDALHVADIEDFLGAGTRAYGLILAADVLVYLGDLAPVMQGVSAHLAPGGAFLFTVERNPKPGFALGEKRRWRHSEDYLRRMAAAHGFELAGLIACTPRLEGGAPVEGICAALVKK